MARVPSAAPEGGDVPPAGRARRSTDDQSIRSSDPSDRSSEGGDSAQEILWPCDVRQAGESGLVRRLCEQLLADGALLHETVGALRGVRQLVRTENRVALQLLQPARNVGQLRQRRERVGIRRRVGQRDEL